MDFYLQNPDKFNKKRKKLILAVVLFALAVFIVIPLVDIWQKKAFNIDYKTQTEVQFKDNDVIVINNSTVIVENYYPLRNCTIYPSLHNITITDDGTLDQDKTNVTIQNIKIDSYEIKREYGDKQLLPPFKVVNATVFPTIKTRGMAKTTLIVNWRYNKTESNAAKENYSIALRYTENPEMETKFVLSGEINLSNRILNLLNEALPYLSFIASGLIFSFIAFKEGKLMSDYATLSKFPAAYQKAGASEKKKMEKSMGNIVEFPKNARRESKLLFGLSIFVVKAMVNNSCKKHDQNIDSYKIAPFRRKSLSEVFSKYKKQTFEKIEDTLPELKTIFVVTTFLASVGITFSFNVGAAAAFLYSLALFYFFFNLGSILQFVLKSSRDRYWTILAISLAIFAVLFPEIINTLRFAV